jgi:hypothetical protein
MLSLWLLMDARAELIARFPLDEGRNDPSTNQVYSTVGGWVGAITAGFRDWFVTDLPPVPTGSQACLFLNGSFPGIDPHVVTACQGVLGNRPRTVSAWIRGTLPQANLAVLVSWGRNTRASRYTFRIETASGLTEGRLRLEASGQAIVGETLVLDGRWHHVAVVTPAGGSTHDSILFVDGVPEVSSRVGTAVPLDTKVDPFELREWLHIGNGGWQPADYGYTGSIDEVRVYDEMLGGDQIRELASREGDPPRFTRLVDDASVMLGDPVATARFRAGVAGRGPLRYEWRFRGVVLPQQTGSELVINGVRPSLTGEYRVIASNPWGSVGDSAVLRLTTGPVEPAQQSALVGGAATFRVRMPAVEGYRYQWEHDGELIPEATTAELSRINLRLADAGLYRVRVGLGELTVTSAPVVLQVLATPPSTYPATVLREGPEAYWRLGETNGSVVARDTVGAYPASFVQFGGGGLEIPGVVIGDADTAAQFAPSQFNFVDRALSGGLNDLRSFSVEVWVRPTLGTEGALVTALANLPSTGYQLSVLPGGEVRFRTGASSNPAARQFDDLVGGRLTAGDWNLVVATYDGRTKRLFVNGALVGEQTVPILPSPERLFRLGAGNGPSTTPGTVLNGQLDEVAVYRKVLDPVRIMTHFVTAGRSQPGVLIYDRTGSELVLLWGDPGAILESGDAVDGPWGPVPGATSPHTVMMDGVERWYRLRSLE